MSLHRILTPFDEPRTDTVVGQHSPRTGKAVGNVDNTGVWVGPRQDRVHLNGKDVPVHGVYVELRWKGNSVWMVLPPKVAREVVDSIDAALEELR